MCADTPDYKDTLNLPETDFPMRAGLPKREPDWLARWNDLSTDAVLKPGTRLVIWVNGGSPLREAALEQAQRVAAAP